MNAQARWRLRHPEHYRALNRAGQARWRAANPARARALQIAKPSYTSTTGESLGLGRPMTSAEAAQLGHHRRQRDRDEEDSP